METPKASRREGPEGGEVETPNGKENGEGASPSPADYWTWGSPD